MRSLLLCTTCLLMLNFSGWAASADERRDANLRSIGKAMALVRACKSIELSMPDVETHLSAFDVDSNDILEGGRHRGALQTGYLHAQLMIEGKSQTLICAATIALYGDDGRNISGLVVPADK